MLLNKTKNCAQCKLATVYGSNDNLEVSCNSDDFVHKRAFQQYERNAANFCDGYQEKPKNNNDSGTVDYRAGFIAQDKAFEFMLAGKSEFILHSTKTNEDFKFKLDKKDSKYNAGEFIYFVSLKVGRIDQYAGVMWFNSNTSEFNFKEKVDGPVKASSVEIRSLLFVLNKLYKEDTVQYLEVYHVGKCGRCGKKLTTPESILTGLGPSCSKNLGIPRIKLKKARGQK